MLSFALNHMSAPNRDIDAFFDLARELGIASVEIRNDLGGLPLANGSPAGSIGAAARERALRIVSVNALQRFNEWTPARAEEARTLAAQAAGVGAEALVLCPVNQAGWRPDPEQRHVALVEALRALAPILSERGLTGLVEPLGFAECSLRLKSEAVRAIDEAGEAARFRLVHDTFHHFVAGEDALFPERTDLVHISGVEDPAVAREAMRDAHRVLVGPRDRLDTVGQVRALRAGGYRGAVSFEPFASEIAASADIAADLAASMDHVSGALRAEAA